MRRFLALILGVLFLCVPSLVYGDFTDSYSWEVYDPVNDGGVGNRHTSYGSIFDGRYVYYTPFQFTEASGEFMRYDTWKDFDDSSAWEAYDPGAGGLDVGNIDADGFIGQVFDGQYLYFATFYSTNATNTKDGHIIRFNTLDPDGFSDIGSWEAIDLEAEGGVTFQYAEGFWGGTFDGDYVYFVSDYGDGSSAAGRAVVRYDIAQSFTDIASWDVFDTNTEGANARGFKGVVYDGQYLYFVPDVFGGTFLRYNTTGAGFTDNSAWDTYAPGFVPDGYWHAAFDGRYIIFVPHQDINGSDRHGNFARYDTQGSFTSAGSWDSFDPGSAGFDAQGYTPDGFTGAAFDGKYMYFSAWYNGSDYVGEFLRYDTTETFGLLDSWSIYDPGDDYFDGQGYDTDGYTTPTFANNHVYWPQNFAGGSFPTGSIEDQIRYHTTNPRGNSTLSSSTVSATNVQYTVNYLPLLPIQNGDQVVITFPDEYNATFDVLTTSDISISGTHITSATESIDTSANTLTFTLTTSNSGENDVVSPIAITIGDGSTGGLNDLTNPATAGTYAIGIDVFGSSGVLQEQGSALANVASSASLTAIVSEALIFTLSNTSIMVNVDPLVDDGQDLAQSTTITVSSNAPGGYTVAARLDDGNGAAELAGQNGNSIESNFAAGDNYFSYAARNDDTGVLTGAEQDFANVNTTLLDNNDDDIGLAAKTNSQEHTVNYDINVDFLTPSGLYTGTIYYTVVASF